MFPRPWKIPKTIISNLSKHLRIPNRSAKLLTAAGGTAKEQLDTVLDAMLQDISWVKHGAGWKMIHKVWYIGCSVAMFDSVWPPGSTQVDQKLSGDEMG